MFCSSDLSGLKLLEDFDISFNQVRSFFVELLLMKTQKIFLLSRLFCTNFRILLFLFFFFSVLFSITTFRPFLLLVHSNTVHYVSERHCDVAETRISRYIWQSNSESNDTRWKTSYNQGTSFVVFENFFSFVLH